MHEVENEQSDSDVIRDILDGNVDAFETLMDRYQAYVSGIAAKHIPTDRIHEVAHETFVRAYQSLGTFRAKTPFKHWLATVTVRCCYDFWRAHYRNRETPVSSISEEGQQWLQALLVDGSVASQEGLGSSREALSVLRWAMEKLSAEDRMVLTLIHLEEHTIAEAAELLRWSVPKVKIRAYRARMKLRKTLSNALPGR